MRTLIYTVILFLGWGLAAYSQRDYPHSLAIGLQNGVATVTRFELKASTIALDLNHQRNLNKVFSWRTGFQLGYVFPAEYQVIASTQNQSIGLSQRITSEYLQLNLTTMPVFYYREKKFALFIGVGGGLGGQFQFNTYYRTDNDGNDLGIPAQKTDAAALMLGWKPVIGASFNMGSTQGENELEVMFSRETWFTLPINYTRAPFYWYAITLAYRHNFKEG